MKRQTEHFHIERDDEAETSCDAPHPMRLQRGEDHYRGECSERQEAIEAGRRGYLCPGGQPHYYTLWHVIETATDEQVGGGAFDRFPEAVSAMLDLEQEWVENHVVTAS